MIHLQLDSDTLIGALALTFSVVALFFSLKDSRQDRINSNSWEIYKAYNSEPVRKGRDLSLKILNDTKNMGFATHTDYMDYFQTHAFSASLGQVVERQYLHDLAAFYHQTGILLKNGLLNRDLTLLIVGFGLEDRWNLFRNFGEFFEGTKTLYDSRTYGGIYLLYAEFIRWNRRRYPFFRKIIESEYERLLKENR